MGTFASFGLLLLLCLYTRAEEDSSEYGQFRGIKSTSCNCGWTNKGKSRIVNGVVATENEYPWVALLKSNGRAICGASLITQTMSISAAHCTYGTPAQFFSITFGAHDTRFYNGNEVTVRVSQKVEHENYDNRRYIFDIVLLKHSAVPISQKIGPVCMPSGVMSYMEGQEVKVKGWGRTTSGGVTSPVLLKTWLRIFSLQKCSSIYSSFGISTTSPIQFCTYTEGTDACQGDSGGPLVWLDPETNRYVLRGLVSYGIGCASRGYPGVNTDVSRFVAWIQSKLNLMGGGRTCTKVG